MRAIELWHRIVKRMAQDLAGKMLDFRQDGDGRPFFYAVIRDNDMRHEAQNRLETELGI